MGEAEQHKILGADDADLTADVLVAGDGDGVGEVGDALRIAKLDDVEDPGQVLPRVDRRLLAAPAHLLEASHLMLANGEFLRHISSKWNYLKSRSHERDANEADDPGPCRRQEGRQV